MRIGDADNLNKDNLGERWFGPEEQDNEGGRNVEGRPPRDEDLMKLLEQTRQDFLAALERNSTSKGDEGGENGSAENTGWKWDGRSGGVFTVRNEQGQMKVFEEFGSDPY